MSREKKSLIHKFQIQTKEGTRQFYIPNAVQTDFSKRRTGRDYILKARQMGISTDAQLGNLEYAMLNKDVTVATIAHNKDRSDSLFQMSKFAWDNLHESIRKLYQVRYDNVRELVFGATGSRLYVSTDVRGDTVQRLHISELNFMQDIKGVFRGSLQAVPKGGSIVIESTGNGMNEGQIVWQEAKEGKNGFTPHFYNWTWDKEYREVLPPSSTWKDDYKVLAKRYGLIEDIQDFMQIDDEQWYWYYLKAGQLKESVKAEYPCTDMEAFLSLSTAVFNLYDLVNYKPVELLKTYRGWKVYEEARKSVDYIIGVDTSEGIDGDYSSAEVYRIDEKGRMINVASFKDNSIRPDKFGELLIEVGRIYNNAFIIPERNSSGLTTTLTIQNAGYSNLYSTKRLDRKTNKSTREYGWRTTSTNRDMMIDEFVAGWEEGEIVVNSPYVLEEMKSFVRQPSGKREHEEGFHDDSLFASFLAVQGRKFLSEFKATKQNVYPMFNTSHIITESKAKLKNLCIGIDCSPEGLVYVVFGIDWAGGEIVGLEEGEGSVESITELAEEYRKRGTPIVLAGIPAGNVGLSSELRKLGIRATIIKSSIEQGVGRIQSLFKEDKLRLSVRQEKLTEEVRGYLFDYDRLQEGVGLPIGGFRYAEAMRLSIMGMWSMASKISRRVLQSGEDSAIMNEEMLS